MGGHHSKSLGNKFAGAISKTKSSIISKYTDQFPRRTIQMVQNVLLIWLDSNIDKDSADYRNTLTQFRQIMNSVDTFTNSEDCMKFLKDLGDEKVCMIISNSLDQNIVPKIHGLTQVDTIFIFYTDEEEHEASTENWPKIKGVFTERIAIYEALKKIVRQCEQNSIPISLMNTGDQVSNKKLDQLDPSFVYTMSMKEILLDITFKEQHVEEYLDYCRHAFAENKKELQSIERFEQQRGEKSAVWWYTPECFLYPMLNRALRTMDTNIIIKMGFFIVDLHHQIDKLHKKQFDDNQLTKNIVVYRGQGVTKSEFDKLQQTKGGLLSFNSFLSTSKKLEDSMSFARAAITNPENVGILFVMNISLDETSIPFALTADFSDYSRAKEEEVLFAMHSIFRINDIEPIDDYPGIFRMNLTLTSDKNNDLQELTEWIRQESFPNSTGWYRMGLLLQKMGEIQKAQQIYEDLLKQESVESEKASIYNQLGIVNEEQENHKEALNYYEKALTIRKKLLPSNHPELATLYNNIGLIYNNMGEYEKALASHKKALAMQQQSLPRHHPDLASSYGNMGAVYDNMGKYAKALSSHENALAIQQQLLPPNHPDLASSHGNIGTALDNMGEYAKALLSYEKTLEIQQISLPANHPLLASTYNSIGAVYNKIGEYARALSFHEKALAVWQQSFSPDHPLLATCYNNIGEAYFHMNEHMNARSFHEKALAIRQRSLPSNHPDLAASYHNLGLLYEKRGDIVQASALLAKAVDIAEKSSPINHRKLKQWKNNLDKVKNKL